jgi:flagellar biosynthesis protein FlhF
VLIDTGGVNPFAAAELAELAELAASCAAIPVLVMPAGQHPDEAAEQAAAFSPLGAGHLLATRLDLARRLGSLITAAVAGDLILTEAGVGSGPADSLVALTPEFLAARLRPAPAAAAPPAAPAPKPPAGLPLPHAGLPRTPQTRQGADGYST